MLNFFIAHNTIRFSLYYHFIQENVQNHNYASDPLEWPLLTRGIAYFISKESNAQVTQK